MPLDEDLESVRREDTLRYQQPSLRRITFQFTPRILAGRVLEGGYHPHSSIRPSLPSGPMTVPAPTPLLHPAVKSRITMVSAVGSKRRESLRIVLATPVSTALTTNFKRQAFSIMSEGMGRYYGQ